MIRRKTNKLILPVLKWVGGKRQLIPELDKLMPKTYNRYIEPFIGGGALLFHLQPKIAIISDINEELINLYNVIKNTPDELIIDLKKHENSKEYFYIIRSLDRDKSKYERLTSIEKASRLIFLNKTCYNGLFRVNNSGEFNSPFGSYLNPNIVNEYTIKAVSLYFNENKIDIECDDYSNILKKVRQDDFVYLDPPYDPISDSSNFTGYTKNKFDKIEQIRLKNECDELSKKQVKFMLSNSSTDFILDLYDSYNVYEINAKRSINSDPSKRGEITEVVITNYA